jgi:hypothetical protein
MVSHQLKSHILLRFYSANIVFDNLEYFLEKTKTKHTLAIRAIARFRVLSDRIESLSF